jgi:hypothetical protein
MLVAAPHSRRSFTSELFEFEYTALNGNCSRQSLTSAYSGPVCGEERARLAVATGRTQTSDPNLGLRNGRRQR